MKKSSAIIIGVSVAVILLVLSKVINYGQTSGYYGDYNSIMQSLEGMPDIEIINEDINYDTTIEEIYLTLIKDNNITFNLYFAQDEPFRKTRGEELATELRKRIDKEISNQKLDPTVKTPVESGNEQGTAGQL
jgi:hypothetical protein